MLDPIGNSEKNFKSSPLQVFFDGIDQTEKKNLISEKNFKCAQLQ